MRLDPIDVIGSAGASAVRESHRIFSARGVAWSVDRPRISSQIQDFSDVLAPMGNIQHPSLRRSTSKAIAAVLWPLYPILNGNGILAAVYLAIVIVLFFVIFFTESEPSFAGWWLWWVVQGIFSPDRRGIRGGPRGLRWPVSSYPELAALLRPCISGRTGKIVEGRLGRGRGRRGVIEEPGPKIRFAARLPAPLPCWINLGLIGIEDVLAKVDVLALRPPHDQRRGDEYGRIGSRSRFQR